MPRSASVRKWMVRFKLLAEPQRDITPEQFECVGLLSMRRVMRTAKLRTNLTATGRRFGDVNDPCQRRSKPGQKSQAEDGHEPTAAGLWYRGRASRPRVIAS